MIQLAQLEQVQCASFVISAGTVAVMGCTGRRRLLVQQGCCAWGSYKNQHCKLCRIIHGNSLYKFILSVTFVPP